LKVAGAMGSDVHQQQMTHKKRQASEKLTKSYSYHTYEDREKSSYMPIQVAVVDNKKVYEAFSVAMLSYQATPVARRVDVCQRHA